MWLAQLANSSRNSLLSMPINFWAYGEAIYGYLQDNGFVNTEKETVIDSMKIIKARNPVSWIYTSHKGEEAEANRYQADPRDDGSWSLSRGFGFFMLFSWVSYGLCSYVWVLQFCKFKRVLGRIYARGTLRREQFPRVNGTVMSQEQQETLLRDVQRQMEQQEEESDGTRVPRDIVSGTACNSEPEAEQDEDESSALIRAGTTTSVLVVGESGGWVVAALCGGMAAMFFCGIFLDASLTGIIHTSSGLSADSFFSYVATLSFCMAMVASWAVIRRAERQYRKKEDLIASTKALVVDEEKLGSRAASQDNMNHRQDDIDTDDLDEVQIRSRLATALRARRALRVVHLVLVAVMLAVVANFLYYFGGRQGNKVPLVLLHVQVAFLTVYLGSWLVASVSSNINRAVCTKYSDAADCEEKQSWTSRTWGVLREYLFVKFAWLLLLSLYWFPLFTLVLYPVFFRRLRLLLVARKFRTFDADAGEQDFHDNDEMEDEDATDSAAEKGEFYEKHLFLIDAYGTSYAAS
jgi:hypothetical protein